MRCPSTWYKFWHTICFLQLFMLHHKVHKWENLLCMTGVSINQGCDSETYLHVLHCMLCVGYLFHVSTSDSFDTNSFQVDLVIEGVIKGPWLFCTSIRVLPSPVGGGAKTCVQSCSAEAKYSCQKPTAAKLLSWYQGWAGLKPPSRRYEVSPLSSQQEAKKLQS